MPDNVDNNTDNDLELAEFTEPAPLSSLAKEVQCEFITGSAGTGKTYTLMQRIRDDPRYALLASTTGISAVNLGTITLNSLLGYYDTASLMDNYSRGYLQAKLRKLILQYRVKNIAIDEVSMMPAEQLDIIYQAVREVNDYATVKQPLGIVVTGDFLQLPPIKARYAFHAECWPHFAANTTRLTKIWRQSDSRFLDAINFLRSGHGLEAGELIYKIAKMAPSVDDNFDGTTIFPTNKEVDRHNLLRLMKLAGDAKVMGIRTWGKQRGEWKNIPEELKIKTGMLCMILNNDAPRFSYVNGDLGHVLGYENEKFQIELIRTGEVVSIGRIHRTNITKDEPTDVSESEWGSALGMNAPFGRVSFDEERGVWHIGGIVYYPLRAAYATTVHKTQSLSLDRVQVDCRGQFMGSPGMLYTAVSRCRTPEGLRIVGSMDTFINRCSVDPEVIGWL